jgi:aspartyl-tRNA(Asn)/glutamyl-tRNA(Gln) amidotransferase subunit C
MEFSRDDVIKLAKLARLHLTDEEIEQYRGDLSSILGYVEKLQALDTENVPEFQHAAGGENVFRTDEVQNCEEDVRSQAIENFTNKEGDLLKVQAVFGNRE